MLSIGDVSFYSSCTYIAAELVKMGFESKMCAGVPSFCAAAAELNIPLSEGSEPLTIIPAQYEAAREMLERDGTKVIMKSGKKLSDIKEMLSGRETVFAAENCGFPGQKLYRHIDEITDCGYFTVMIVKYSQSRTKSVSLFVRLCFNYAVQAAVFQAPLYCACDRACHR